MKRNLMLILSIVCFISVFIGTGIAGEETADSTKKVTHEYVGDKKCKICHKKDGIHPSWLETKHAKAWDALKPEDQKNKECVACHSTGTTAKGELLTGVQCEVCHGPGSDYKKKKIMEDQKASVANGLLLPDENTCKSCHNENVPEEFRAKEKF
ncbi:MAG: cytochrome c3 family protein, partial [candidate division Zixibacteria bacterium]|nr:cytochrome c3 family protein [candidate division Zixibacteria bacterium]